MTEPPDATTALTGALLQDLLAAERELRTAAEEEAAASRQALEQLARELEPEWVDALRKQRVAGLGALSTAELGAQLSRRLQPRLGRLTTPPAAPQAESAAQLQAALAERTHQLQVATAEVARLQAAVARWSRAPVAVSPPPARPPPPAAAPAPPPEPAPAPEDSPEDEPDLEPDDFVPQTDPATWPGWFSAWLASRGFANDRRVVQQLGQTGEPRRARLLQALGAATGQTAKAGGLRRAVARLVELGLVTLQTAAFTSRQGAPSTAELIYLTDTADRCGTLAFRLLYGTAPVRQDARWLLARHKSAEHAYLILETQELLEQAGFAVDRFPAAWEVAPELGRYAPDLAATLDGRTIYVEVERDTYKNDRERERKFRRYWAVTQGEFWVATDTPQAAQALLSELSFQAGQLQQPVQVHLLALHAVDPRHPPTGWDLWPPAKVLLRG